MAPTLILLAACGLFAEPKPFAGEATLHVELTGSGATASTDGPILVTRLEALGASATSSAPKPDTIALEISNIRDTQVISEVIKGYRVEIAFPSGDTLTNADIAAGQGVRSDFTNQPEVRIEFTESGSKRFCTLSEKHVNQQVPFRVDGVELMSPVIREKICGGQAMLMLGAGSASDLEDQSHAMAAALSAPTLASDWTLAVVR